MYGQTEEAVKKARTGAGGRLHVSDDGVPMDVDGTPLVGDRNNGWAGVALLQVLQAVTFEPQTRELR